jgi:hypothetical protein
MRKADITKDEVASRARAPLSAVLIRRQVNTQSQALRTGKASERHDSLILGELFLK